MKKFVRLMSLMLVAALLCVALVSCGGPAKDPKDAKSALKDADYEVMLLDDKDTIKMMDVDGLEAVLYAGHEDDEEGIVIYYFEDAASAKEAYEDIEDELEDVEEEFEDKDVVIKQSGAMIYAGTKQAVKDAK